ncbi:MAG: hypothetical protein KA428_13005, partial [Chitinophagaceae bacterium]|nr:hypothetical protein [Chitinophagaceae bacterium]
MKLLITAVLLLLTMVTFSQTTDTVTNQTIIQLHKAGLGKDVLKSKIQSSTCNFDLSTEGLIALKKAGIPDEVINTMLNKSNATSTNISTQNNTVASTDTAKNVSPGIYYCKGKPCDLMELEASVYSQAKMGSGLLTSLTYGIAKTKMKATLSGDEANLQVKETSPTFYFYFDKSSSNSFGNNGAQSFWFASATSPNEFLLVKFTATKKSREVVTGSWNSYAGMSSGIDDDNKISFKYEKLSQGVYRVYTEQPLKKGEYCFMYAGGTATYGGAPLQK